MTERRDVSVTVPADRLPEFYEWFGRWLGSPPPEARVTSGNQAASQWEPARDIELAVEAWDQFPERARNLFGVLIDHPDRHYWGDQLADLLDIPNGRYGIAGVLAWPARRLKPLGRPLPIETEPDPRGGSDYWMTPALARLFAAARRRSAERI